MALQNHRHLQDLNGFITWLSNFESFFFVFYLTKEHTSLLCKSHLNLHNIKIYIMKRNTLKTGILLGMISFLFTISTNAQSSDRRDQQNHKPPTFSELLKKMDKNEDGKLSKEEVNGPLKDDFAKIDADEDGYITKKEFDKAPKPKRKER